MRRSYYPLRRSGAVRPPKRPSADTRLVIVAVAAAVWMVAAGPIGPRDETARAESIGGPSLTSAAVAIPIPPAREARPELSPRPFLSANADVITCPQPTVGAFRPSGSACMRTTLPDADILDETRASASSATTVDAAAVPATLANPVAPASDVTGPVSPAKPAAEPEPRGPTVTASLPDAAATEKAGNGSPVRSGAGASVKPPASMKVGTLDAKLKGRWIPRVAGCSGAERSSDCLSLTVGPSAAKAGPTTCRFSDITRDGNRWNMLARCTSDGERWTSHVQLTLSGKKMSWNSERGRQDYLR